jgi:hypothetical protein
LDTRVENTSKSHPFSAGWAMLDHEQRLVRNHFADCSLLTTGWADFFGSPALISPARISNLLRDFDFCGSYKGAFRQNSTAQG